MKKIKKIVTLRLALGVAYAIFTQLVFGQYQTGELAQASPAEQGAASPEQTEPISEPKYFLPQIVGAQYTYIHQHLYPFSAAYSGKNSLTADGDIQSTDTFGLYLGMNLIKNLQAYVDVEMFKGAGIGGTVGLGGLTNGDVIRQGATDLPKTPYIARRYLKYTLPFGDQMEKVERAQDQLPGTESTTRLEFKVGTFATTDDFDHNRYANSTRTQFQNWDLWNNMAWDYAADTRGYSNGIYVGYISPRWELRASVMQMPSVANGQDLDAPLSKARGEQLELMLKPNQYGTVARLLVYENIARMGIYSDAIAIAAAQGTVPDISADDEDGRKRLGLGINLEQPLADDGETGLFIRLGWNDGKEETFANTEVDQTATFGAQISGARWKRPDDRFGIGIAINGLSSEHRDYLALGGSGFDLGDGTLNYRPEQIGEVYYRIQIWKYVQVSPDFQYIRNPGYNYDRGPARVAGFRVHLEY